MPTSTEKPTVVPIEVDDDIVVGSQPPEGLFLLKPHERSQLQKPPKHGEELARALLVGLTKRASVAELADIKMDTIEQHILDAEEATTQAHQAYWQYRSLQDKALQSGHEYWSVVLKAWSVIKGAIAANPSIVADFPELHEYFSQHGAKVSAGKKKTQQSNSDKNESE